MQNEKCSLTGKVAPFVKSHIIPNAFSRPSQQNGRFVEGGGKYLKTVPTSWYDKNLVCREGEDILSFYDDFGIKELRRLHLVNTGMGPILDASKLDMESIGGIYGSVRIVRPSDGEKFRLFLLSILWRAAKTSLPAFKEIQISAKDDRKLRRALIEQKSPPEEFYPISIVQLYGNIPRHNISPESLDEIIPTGDRSNYRNNIFRIYMDGLVVHFHKQYRNRKYPADCPVFFVGCEDELALLMKPFKDSKQKLNLDMNVVDAMIRYPSKINILKSIKY